MAEQEFYDRTFTAAQLRDFSSAGSFVGAEFHDCRFQSLEAGEHDLTRASFLGCEFQGCDLSNAKIRGAVFRSPKFTDSKLIGLDWTSARSLDSLSFERCVLSYA